MPRLQAIGKGLRGVCKELRRKPKDLIVADMSEIIQKWLGIAR